MANPYPEKVWVTHEEFYHGTSYRAFRASNLDHGSDYTSYVRSDVVEDGNRPLPFDREQLGRMVREAWVRWAQAQSNPKPSWLVPYDELSELDKEADRQIGEAISRWTLIGDAARISMIGGA